MNIFWKNMEKWRIEKINRSLIFHFHLACIPKIMGSEQNVFLWVPPPGANTSPLELCCQCSTGPATTTLESAFGKGAVLSCTDHSDTMRCTQKMFWHHL